MKKKMTLAVSMAVIMSLTGCTGRTDPAVISEVPAESTEAVPGTGEETAASAESTPETTAQAVQSEAAESTQPAETESTAEETAVNSTESAGIILPEIDPELVVRAREEGTLVVYGSCGSKYLAAAAAAFEAKYGIKVKYKEISEVDALSKIQGAGGEPAADVWFGASAEYCEAAEKRGLLETYAAQNAVDLPSEIFRDPQANWYGISRSIVGFMVNMDELQRLGLEAPKDWSDLLKPEYEGLIWMPNYSTSGTAKHILNAVVQKYGIEQGIQYLCDLDRNIELYTKNGDGPSMNVGSGECVIGIGLLTDAIYQIEDNAYKNIKLVIPASGTSGEISAAAILKGAKHPEAAKLWIEFALSAECEELAQKNGDYQLPLIGSARQPMACAGYGIYSCRPTYYDFCKAAEYIDNYQSRLMDTLTAGGVNVNDSSRFQID